MLSRPPRIRACTFAVQSRHLPYPLNPGLCYHVPTYPWTRPFMTFVFLDSLLCYRLPLHKASRLCSCLLLIIAVHLNKTYRGSLIGDLHPISSCPCRAYTNRPRPTRECFVALRGEFLGRAARLKCWGDATPRNLHGCPVRTLRTVAFSKFC